MGLLVCLNIPKRKDNIIITILLDISKNCNFTTD